MLGLYIHVPFCKQRCAYCHFDIKVLHPRTDNQTFFRRYLEALTVELNHGANLVEGREVTSVFYGGGTPSRLGLEHLSEIHQRLQANFTLSHDCEVSMEVNPEDATAELLAGLHGMGVNRLSLGIQTFEDPILKTLRRAHDRERALQAVADAPQFERGLSLDLMLGLPGQDEASLQRDLDRIAAIAPQHLALYMLERDLPTPIDKLAEQYSLPDEDQQADFYLRVAQFLEARDYRHYEISNFSKPGFQCRHNLNYWQSGDYLGLGPAAHGRLGNVYTMNHGRFQDYLQAVEEQGHGLAQQEVWDEKRLHQERLIQALRLDQGILWGHVSDTIREDLQSFFEHGLLEHHGDHISLTRRGRLLANEVFAVFLDEERACPE